VVGHARVVRHYNVYWGILRDHEGYQIAPFLEATAGWTDDHCLDGRAGNNPRASNGRDYHGAHFVGSGA